MVEVARPLDNERKLCYITKHFTQWNFCFDHLYTMLAIHTFQHTTTTVKVTRYITHVLIWSKYFHFHDWLKQYGFALRPASRKPCLSTQFKAHRIRSTWWKLPSNTRTFMLSIGYPASTPVVIAVSKPF